MLPKLCVTVKNVVFQKTNSHYSLFVVVAMTRFMLTLFRKQTPESKLFTQSLYSRPWPVELRAHPTKIR